MRSLKSMEDGNAGIDAVRKYEIKEGRKWDERYVCNSLLYVYVYVSSKIL